MSSAVNAPLCNIRERKHCNLFAIFGSCALFGSFAIVLHRLPLDQQPAEGFGELRFIKALCKLMIKGQSMQYYGAAAKKGADAEGRWLQAKRAAVANSQEVLKKSGAGGGAGTSVGSEAWHMYVDTKSPEFRGLMTALVSLDQNGARPS